MQHLVDSLQMKSTRKGCEQKRPEHNAENTRN